MARWVSVLLVALAVFLPSVYGQRNSQSYREQEDASIRQSPSQRAAAGRTMSGNFRVGKLESIWERAQQQLNLADQRSILEELEDLDNDATALKRIHRDGGDKNGDIKAKLRDRLDDLVEKYDLQPLPRSKGGSRISKHQKDGHSKRRFNAEPDSQEQLFDDQKLNKLWGKAKRAGFSGDELMNLKSDFDLHQEKLDKYHELGRDVPDMDMDEFNRFYGLADGLTYGERQNQRTGEKVSADDIDRLATAAKELTKSYGRLKAIVHNSVYVADDEDSRVEDLWKQALKSGFNRDELLSLREELNRFERKMTNLRNFRDGNRNAKSQDDRNVGRQSEERIDVVHQKMSVKSGNAHADSDRRTEIHHSEL